MRSILNRFKCDVCGSQQDCTDQDLIHKATGYDLTVPEGWLLVDARVHDESVAKSTRLSRSDDEGDSVCSTACAHKALVNFAEKFKPHTFGEAQTAHVRRRS